MKPRSSFLFAIAAGVAFFTSFVLSAASVPFTVSFYYPTNGQKFMAPATVGIHALVLDSNAVKTVQYFSGTASLRIITNTSTVLLTNSSQGNPFEFAWSNVLAGTYSLTAVATDSAGNSVTSSPVSVTVTNPPPPKPAVYIYSPTNGEKYLAPASVAIYARAVETPGSIAFVTFKVNSNVVGVVSNSMSYSNVSSEPLYMFLATNIQAGSAILTATATDTNGNSAVSTAVTITVTNPPPAVPFTVSFYYPTNGESYTAPANVALHALVLDSNWVKSVQYFSGTTSLGMVSNTSTVLLTNSTQGNAFEFTWSNVLAGAYSLTAVATDSAGHTATSAPVTISVTNLPPPPPPKPVAYIYSPVNGAKYSAPASVAIYARAVETGGSIAFVTFEVNSNIVGVASNSMSYSNISSEPLYMFVATNLPAGSAVLTAIATDTTGNSASSYPVTITITNPPAPTPFTVGFYYPLNGQSYLAPATVAIHARVTDSNIVETVRYFSGTNSLAIVSNKAGVLLTNSSQGNPFEFTWSNVVAGVYSLTAVATDIAGNIATSGPVTITVTNPPPPPPTPFAISFFYPTNGQTFIAPASIGVHARVTDSNVVSTVQYFANGASIGVVANPSGVLLTNTVESNPFFLLWSNVPSGFYALTAVATDKAGAVATSAPVNIWVLPTPDPVVTIYAPDPVAVEGTNAMQWYVPTNCYTNYCSGSNTATFLVRRDSGTNANLTVNYAIGGTATNGVDYASIPTNVTILAGHSYALITIIPLLDNDTNRSYDTVVLTLSSPPFSSNAPPSYAVGSPSQAGAVILEQDMVPIPTPIVHNFPDGTVHVSIPSINGLNTILETSADLVHWQAVCTNTVVKGSSQYVDPGAAGNAQLFYRIVATPAEPSY